MHVIYAFFGYTAKKSGFSEGRGANFVDIARRHSLGIYLLGIKSILEESLIYYFLMKFKYACFAITAIFTFYYKIP